MDEPKSTCQLCITEYKAEWNAVQYTYSSVRWNWLFYFFREISIENQVFSFYIDLKDAEQFQD